MYEQLAPSLRLRRDEPRVHGASNPWALRGITERLLEAADRGLWAEPEAGALDRLRAAYLELEGDLEGDA